MVRCLRARRCGGHERSNGLILANGGVLTHENALCLSTRPRPNGTPYPVDEFDNNCSVSEDQVAVVPATTGEATIEVGDAAIGILQAAQRVLTPCADVHCRI